MSSQPKYRAWYKPLGVMIEPDKLEMINFETKVLGVYLEMDGKGYHVLRMSDFELMEFTGLKDEEEIDIHDGDLCTDDEVSVMQVVWVEDHHQWGVKVISGSGTLSVGLIFPLWHWDICKQNGLRQLTVIGNIYENPELIGGEAAKV
ncbi:YopX family protein [Paenibacillus sp. DMB5]|uniref:YopX family protein n=1 Tax=Paenibacillus sp. DMB5 TaxID=1780103 RepID=UPI00076D715B|nr:YopX family protein [Paenibacillus sp. DMB5]KUP22390.1 hypothetical protein AWJ19_27615 [Paenibacillus sp. DMB5]